jgi:hypothetical protein
VAALDDTLIHVSWLAVHLPGHLAGLDINPLRVSFAKTSSDSFGGPSESPDGLHPSEGW